MISRWWSELLDTPSYTYMMTDQNFTLGQGHVKIQIGHVAY